MHLRLLAPIRLAENIRPGLGTPQLCCIPSHVPLITNIRRHCQHIDLPSPRSVWAIDGSSRPRDSKLLPKIANDFLSPVPTWTWVSSRRVSDMLSFVTGLIASRPITYATFYNSVLFDSHSRMRALSAPLSTEALACLSIFQS